MILDLPIGQHRSLDCKIGRQSCSYGWINTVITLTECYPVSDGALEACVIEISRNIVPFLWLIDAALIIGIVVFIRTPNYSQSITGSQLLLEKDW